MRGINDSPGSAANPPADSSVMREALAIKLIEILNDNQDVASAIDRMLKAIKQATGFSAIGIRLRQGDDFPYFSHEGFSNDFLLTENSLVVRNKRGDICRNKDGSICLECTCGLVLSGHADLSNPLFTTGGSAWTNDSLPILDIPPELDPRHNPRNRCIHDGFMSVALIPIRNKNEIVGLLQLNDRRKDRLTLEMVSYFEALSAGIGVALMRINDEELLNSKTMELKESNKKLRAALKNVKKLSGLLPICAHCKKIRDDKGYWSQIELYIQNHSEANFSHGICPDCAEKFYPEYIEKKKKRNYSGSEVHGSKVVKT
jgi:hypothetical protein